MAVKNIVSAIPMTSINANTFNGTYMVINAAGLPQACTLLRIMNKSNVDVLVSYDGVTDNDYVQANTTLEINPQLNAQPNNYHAAFPKSMPVYVNGAHGAGLVYLVGYYQPNIS
jgi:hypothetical protein